MRSALEQKILPFPAMAPSGKAKDISDVHGSSNVPFHGEDLEGSLFVIDEPDPLAADVGRCADLIPDNDRTRQMRVIEGGAQADSKDKKLRLKDLHPMDCVIIIGFMLIAIIL